MLRSSLMVMLLASAAARAQPAPTAPSAPDAQNAPPPGAAPSPAPPPPSAGTQPDPALAPPAGAPTAPPPPRTGVMAHRWSGGVGLGIESMTPKSSDTNTTGSTTGFATFELSGRFRPWPAIEFALALDLATAGNLTSTGIYADFRYRFMAERPFNVFAMAGIGGAAAYDKNTPVDAEKKARGALRLGAGVEWRFDTLAVTGEVRFFGIGENKNVQATAASPDNVQFAAYSISGAALILGATYYF